MATLYELLGASETASQEEIKDGYRRQAMKWHPDRNPNNTAEAEIRFKEIANAYRVLSEPNERAKYDEWLSNQRKSSARQESHFSHGHQGREFSDDAADNLFFEEMLDLARELAARGYSEATITKVLKGLDCPEAIAKAVAARAAGMSRERPSDGASRDDGRDRSDRGESAEDTIFSAEARSGEVKSSKTHASPADEKWNQWKPYFIASLVGAESYAVEEERYGIIKTVRFTLFAASTGVILGIMMQGNNDPQYIIGAVTISILVGWAAMFGALQLSPTHRQYVISERIRKYLPMYERMVYSKQKWADTSGSLLFPVPWFGYYGILWPLIAVTAVYFCIDFLILINVNESVFDKTFLLAVWDFTRKPWLYFVIWAVLAYTFNFLLYTETRSKLEPFVTANRLDKDAIYKICGPKLWRAVLVTLAFFIAVLTPSVFLFGKESDEITLAVKMGKRTAEELFALAKEGLSGRGQIRPDEALILLRAAAVRGHVPAESALAWEFGSGGHIAKDMTKAIYWMERAAVHGDSWANAQLGNFYYSGKDGIAKDDGKALRSWSIAAEKGNASAQVSLGWAYMVDIGGSGIDYQKAVQWNSLGAKNGDPEGFNNLGWLYENGKGVARNTTTAIEMYRRASELGNKEATERLASLLAGTSVVTSKTNEERQLDIAINEIELTYPMLNPRSPLYQQKAVDECIRRQKRLIEQGLSPSNALRQCIVEMERESLISRSAHR